MKRPEVILPATGVTLRLRLGPFEFAHSALQSVRRLLRYVWGDRISGDRQALKQLVHRLRQKIEAHPAEPRYLLSAAGVGYRLEVSGPRGE